MWFLGIFISKRLWMLSFPGDDFVSRSGSEQFNSFTVNLQLKSALFSSRGTLSMDVFSSGGSWQLQKKFRLQQSVRRSAHCRSFRGIFRLFEKGKEDQIDTRFFSTRFFLASSIVAFASLLKKRLIYLRIGYLQKTFPSFLLFSTASIHSLFHHGLPGFTGLQ